MMFELLKRPQGNRPTPRADASRQLGLNFGEAGQWRYLDQVTEKVARSQLAQPRHWRNRMPTPTKQQAEQAKEEERQERDKLNALIGSQVMQALGRPPDMQRLQVRRLWETYYRINVFVGQDIASAKVARSYFVRTNPDGRILESNPAIRKAY
jgi:hypothetical protein